MTKRNALTKYRRINRFKEEHKAAYMSWRGMIERCADTKNIHYGGRGIKVCDTWLNFSTFLADMGDPPKDAFGRRLTLDRKDGNQGYNKDNCRWATLLEQSLNKCNYNISLGRIEEIR